MRVSSFKQRLLWPALLVSLCAISACGGDADKPSAEDSKDPAEVSETAANKILAEGFYRGTTSDQEALVNKVEQQADGAVSKPSERSLSKTAEGSLSKTAEGSLPETADESLGDQLDSPKTLVEDLGFSGADADTEVAGSEPAPQTDFFCLSEQDVTPSSTTPEQACGRISKRLASVKYEACNAAKLKPTGCASVKGFPILMRKFEPLANREPQGRILIIGGTHGDELTSVSVTLRWIGKLNQYHSGLFHWHMVPMMNPDAVLKRAASRTNQNGVDLNRNMPSNDWEENAIKYWEQKGGKDPRKYPGEKAASEPETQWLIDEINHFKPDAIISVHAPYGVVDFDSLLLNTAPKSLGKLHLNLLGTYPGSLGNYAGINRNIPVITLELPHSWVMPSETETAKIWEDIVSWLRKNINSNVAKN